MYSHRSHCCLCSAVNRFQGCGKRTRSHGPSADSMVFSLCCTAERTHGNHSGSVLGFWVCEFSVETVEWPTDRPCELVVGGRNTHAWPPNLDTMPSHWTEPFAQLAGELELRDTDIGQRIEFAADEFCFWHIHLKRYLVRRTR